MSSLRSSSQDQTIDNSDLSCSKYLPKFHVLDTLVQQYIFDFLTCQGNHIDTDFYHWQYSKQRLDGPLNVAELDLYALTVFINGVKELG